MDERDERKRTSVEASKCFKKKLRAHHYFRKSMAGTYQLAMRCPVYRRRDSHLGSRTELENLAGDAKGKSTSCEPARLKVPMRRRGADCPVLDDRFHETSSLGTGDSFVDSSFVSDRTRSCSHGKVAAGSRIGDDR
jgi:hypothetical protein